MAAGWLGSHGLRLLYSAGSEVSNLVAYLLVFLFLLLVALFEFSIAAVVFVRVVRSSRVFGDELAHQRHGFFHPQPRGSAVGLVDSFPSVLGR